jgi:hypothetical protein
MYKNATGGDLFGQKCLRALLADSTGVGAFNWMPKMIEQCEQSEPGVKYWNQAIWQRCLGSRRF